MSDLSSPDRKVKVTYAARRRRSRSVASRAGERDSSDEGDGDADAKPSKDNAGGEDGKTGRTQGSPADGEDGKKGRKQRSPAKAKDEALMPPPKTPKTPKTPKPASKAKGRVSRSPSVASLKAEGDANPASAGKSTSAVSKAKAQLAARMQTPQTPESPADDSISVNGESSKSRVRKTEAERKAFLEADPLSGDVEPHRVFCTACAQWVALNPKLRYIMRSWLEHKKACGRTERDGASDAPEDDAVSIAPSAQSARSAPGPSRPSARVATAERKLALVNDPQAKAFTASAVECAVCAAPVALGGDGEYALAEWENHKKACASRSPGRPAAEAPPPAAAAPTDANDGPPGEGAPPPSTPGASTDATAVGSEATPVRTKRAREDDEEEEARAVRPRTEAYRPPQGFLGWLKQPLQTFVRGFREGLAGK